MGLIFLAGAVASIISFWIGFIIAAIFATARDQDYYFEKLEREEGDLDGHKD